MALYLISYDLRKDRDYSRLWAGLHDWNAKRVLESLWLAELLGPAETVRNLLSALVDGDDGLLIIEIERTAEWAVVRAQTPGVDWLWEHIPIHDRAA